MRRGLALSVCLCAAGLVSSEHAWAFAVTDPTSSWSAVTFPNVANRNYDASADQQTGQADSDLVGDATHPVLYRHFDDGGTAALRNDGTLYFRARVNGAKSSPGAFGAYLFIGLEANGDGKLDLFLSASSKSARNSIYGPGAGANVSPSTTSLSSSPIWSILHSNPAAVYAVQSVSGTTDDTTPRPVITDIGANGATDLFVSFGIPMAVVAQYMQSSAGITMDDSTPLRYALATATQDNAINQDVNGVGRSATDWSTRWDTFMNSAVPSGTPVPEPGMAVMLGGVLLAASALRPARTVRD